MTLTGVYPSGDTVRSGNLVIRISNTTQQFDFDLVELDAVPRTLAPSISVQPQSQSVLAGAPVVFSVVANGTPAPSYQWLKNGTPITAATSSTLNLGPVSVADAGTYRVVGNDGDRTSTSTC